MITEVTNDVQIMKMSELTEDNVFRTIKEIIHSLALFPFRLNLSKLFV